MANRVEGSDLQQFNPRWWAPKGAPGHILGIVVPGPAAICVSYG